MVDKSLVKRVQRTRRFVEILQEQKAGCGLDVPASLQIELEEKLQELAELEAQVSGAGLSDPSRSPTPPPAPARPVIAVERSNPPAAPPVPLKIFIAYSHRDRELRAELETHLSLLVRTGKAEIWCDREIIAGEEWKGAIDSALNEADIILLLLSAPFFASDYCYNTEMPRALARHAAGEARVVPVILRPVDGWRDILGTLQALPTDGKPVMRWDDRDEAFADVARGLRRAIDQLAAPREA